jgi:hypothetical protein
MDIVRAKEIISALAEGVDPTTGEVLPDNSVCNKGEIVRAFYAVLNHLDAKKPKKNMPANAGKPWTTEEDIKLKACYEAGMSRKELCVEFERTSGSITSRLARLGVLDK